MAYDLDYPVARFLELYAQHGVFARAARDCGIPTQWLRRKIETDETFRQAFQEADELFVDTLESEAYRRAMIGHEEVQTYRGQKVFDTETVRVINENGVETVESRLKFDSEGKAVPLVLRRKSDTLLAMMLEGRRKKVYAKRIEQTGAEGAPLNVTVVTGVPALAAPTLLEASEVSPRPEYEP
jgi:hypothetical protein